MSFKPFTIRAIYRDGAFWPLEPVDLPEGTRVRLTIEIDDSADSPVIDPDDRKRAAEELLKLIEKNPLPPNAPRFTRDELHERR